MDTSDPNISFNQHGVCKYCENLYPIYVKNFSRSQEEIDHKIKTAAEFIKKRAGQSKYHCVLGMSGGVDSSYTANFIVEKMNLKPLIIHFDNGWNAPIADENIRKIVKKLNLDMITYAIDWHEFKDLQRSFLYASVLDIEMLTDNAIYGALIKFAKEYKIRCIVSGENFSTESGLPKAWRWEKIDAKNIKAIHHSYGTRALKSFPLYGAKKFIFDRIFSGIYYFYPLNIINYSKATAMQSMKKKFDWAYYGGKHYESIFTKFYQAYILPVKFGIDKRRAYLSSLIRNREISRTDALNEMLKPPYDPVALKQDFEYIIKKLEFTETEFNEIMTLPPVAHKAYHSSEHILATIKKLANLLKLKKGVFA